MTRTSGWSICCKISRVPSVEKLSTTTISRDQLGPRSTAAVRSMTARMVARSL
jgi:hypothetical protein